MLPLVQVIAEAEVVAAQAAIDDPARMLVDRGDVGRADMAGIIDPDRRDAAAFKRDRFRGRASCPFRSKTRFAATASTIERAGIWLVPRLKLLLFDLPAVG